MTETFGTPPPEGALAEPLPTPLPTPDPNEPHPDGRHDGQPGLVYGSYAEHQAAFEAGLQKYAPDAADYPNSAPAVTPLNEGASHPITALAEIMQTRKPTLDEWTAGGLSADAYALNYPEPPVMVESYLGTLLKPFEFIPSRAQWEAAGNAPEDYDERYGVDAVPTLPEAPQPSLPGRGGRPIRYLVDEVRDTVRQSGPSTVIFRPGQQLTGFLLDFARSEGILIREV